MTKFILSDLPGVVLEELCYYLEPDFLFDLQFECKALYNPTSNAICRYLKYSFYSNDIKTYPNIKDQYINKKYKNMINLSIEDDKDIGYLKICTNIISLELKYTRSADELKLNKYIPSNLSYLKELKINITNPNYDAIVVSHTNFLSQLEKVHITVVGTIYLNYLTTLLNPKKLKILYVKAETINLLGLEVLKSSFRNLITLSLDCINFTLSEAHRAANFNNLQNLYINGKFSRGTTLDFLGCLDNLKIFDIECYGTIINLKISKSIDHSKIEKLGFITPFLIEFNQLKQMSCLMQLSVYSDDNFTCQLLKCILILPNVQILEIQYLVYPSDHGFDLKPYDFDHDVNQSRDYPVDLPLYTNLLQSESIRKINFKRCEIGMQYILTFLRLFPNIEVVNLKGTRCLKLDNITDCRISKPLLLQLDYDKNKNSIKGSKLNYFKLINLQLI